MRGTLGVAAGGIGAAEVAEKWCEEKGVMVSGGDGFAAPGAAVPQGGAVGVGG